MNVRELMVLKKIITADFYSVDGEVYGSLGELLHDRSEQELVGIKPAKGNGVVLVLKDPEPEEVPEDFLEKFRSLLGDDLAEDNMIDEVTP